MRLGRCWSFWVFVALFLMAGPAWTSNPVLKVPSVERIRTLITSGKYEEAEAAASALLPEMERASGPESLQVAELVDLLVEAVGRGGKPGGPDTRSLAERAVAIKEKALGPDDPEFATSLANLGKLLFNADDYDGARPLLERALAIREKALGPDHPDVASNLSALGNVLWDIGDKATARQFYERSLSIRERVLGPESPETAVTLNNLSGVYHDMGDFSQAEALLERAVAIWEKVFGPESRPLAVGLINLAEQFKDSGDFAAARPLMERALAIQEKVLGPDHPDIGWGLGDLAKVLEATGDLTEARPLLERALAIYEKTYGPEHGEVVGMLTGLANLHREEGDYPTAKSFYERALAIGRKTLGADPYDLARAMANFAGLLAATGDDAQAKELLEKALVAEEKAVGPDHPYVAWHLNSLASLLIQMGKFAEAKTLLERALSINEKAIGADNPYVAWSLINLATVHWEMGETSQALESALRGERVSRDHLRVTARGLAERQALRYAAVRVSGLDVALSIATEIPSELPATARQAWDALIRSRALVLDEMASRNRAIGGGGDPEIARLSLGLTAARQRLANLTVRGSGDDPPDRYHALLENARRDEERAERALAEKSVAYRQELAREQIGLAEVISSLPTDSALVAFARHVQVKRDVLPPLSDDAQAGTESKGASSGTQVPTYTYLALVLPDRSKEPVVVPLGKESEIDPLVSRCYAEAAQGVVSPGRDDNETEAAYRNAGEALRRRVWDPVVARLGRARRVFVVPDGALNLVNFVALPTGRKKYLIETGPQIHYLSAERDLVPPAEPRRQGSGLLAVGGAAFDETAQFPSPAKGKEMSPPSAANKPPPVALAALRPFRGERSGCGTFQSIRFEFLPASQEEVQMVASLWNQRSGRNGEPKARSADTAPNTAAGALKLTGAAAGEAAFKANAPGRRILHLATHGFFLGAQCASALDSARGIAGIVTLEANEHPPVSGENPLLLAGLALAGANHRSAAAPDEEDGILTAEEIAAMDLSGVEWAVLSACDTGVGEVLAGEGVFGLRRAFEIAGAGTLIMSLWSVEDEATLRWMRALYEGRLVRKLGTAEAVREASLTVLRERRAKGQSTHPFYWAGFVAAGDWR